MGIRDRGFIFYVYHFVLFLLRFDVILLSSNGFSRVDVPNAVHNKKCCCPEDRPSQNYSVIRSNTRNESYIHPTNGSISTILRIIHARYRSNRCTISDEHQKINLGAQFRTTVTVSSFERLCNFSFQIFQSLSRTVLSEKFRGHFEIIQ